MILALASLLGRKLWSQKWTALLGVNLLTKKAPWLARISSTAAVVVDVVAAVDTVLIVMLASTVWRTNNYEKYD